MGRRAFLAAEPDYQHNDQEEQGDHIGNPGTRLRRAHNHSTKHPRNLWCKKVVSDKTFH
jgi:hypothetical protein